MKFIGFYTYVLRYRANGSSNAREPTKRPVGALAGWLGGWKRPEYCSCGTFLIASGVYSPGHNSVHPIEKWLVFILVLWSEFSYFHISSSFLCFSYFLRFSMFFCTFLYRKKGKHRKAQTNIRVEKMWKCETSLHKNNKTNHFSITSFVCYLPFAIIN